MTPAQWQHAETVANRAAADTFAHLIGMGALFALFALAVAAAVWTWRNPPTPRRAEATTRARSRGRSGR